MRRISLFTVAALAAGSLGAQGAPRTVTMTLDEAIALARRSNPTYLQSINARKRTTLGMRAAYAAFAPTASSNLGFGWREGRPTFFEGQQVGAATDVLSSNYGISVGVGYSYASLLAPREAAAQIDAAESNVDATFQGVRQQVISAYFNAVQAVKSAELQDSLVNSRRLQVDLSRAKEKVGSGTPLDTKTAEVNLGTQQIAALRAHNQADIAKIQLFQAIGTAPQPSIELTTDLPVSEPTFTLDALLADATAHNANLAATQANVQASEITRKQTTSSYLPSVSFSTGIGGSTSMNTDAKGSARTWPFDFTRSPLTFSAGFNLALWDGYRREQNNQSAAIAVSDARENLRQTRLNLVNNVTSAYMILVSDYKAIDLQNQAASNAKDALDLATERYRVGSASFLELSNAQDAFQTAQNAQLNAIYTYHRDFAALEAAVGRPLR